MRRKEREVTDKEEIRQILENGQVIRIAMNNGLHCFSTEQRKEPSMKSWKRMHMYR